MWCGLGVSVQRSQRRDRSIEGIGHARRRRDASDSRSAGRHHSASKFDIARPRRRRRRLRHHTLYLPRHKVPTSIGCLRSATSSETERHTVKAMIADVTIADTIRQRTRIHGDSRYQPNGGECLPPLSQRPQPADWTSRISETRMRAAREGI